MEKFTRELHIDAINEICKWGRDMEISNDNKKAYMDANLIDLAFDTPIYRIFRIDRLISTLKEKKLCLVKPKLWDDPFENFLLNARGVLDDGTSVSFEPIREQYYGQCWSLKEECDGLWRNYTSYSCKTCTPNDFNERTGHSPVSAKVKTTVGKLMDSFYDETNPFHCLCYFMGKVRYLGTDDIIDYLKKAEKEKYIQDNTNINQILSLLIKRHSFSYEEEVRLIFMRPDDTNVPINQKGVKNPWDIHSDIFQFNINPDLLFDSIEINPWIDESNCSMVINEVKKYYNGNVVRSKLYDHPFFTVKL